jgi:hypothetical protein
MKAVAGVQRLPCPSKLGSSSSLFTELSACDHFRFSSHGEALTVGSILMRVL